MMYPILCKVRYETLHHVFRHRSLWVQIAFSVFMNWMIAPLLMVNTTSHINLGQMLTITAWPFLGISSRQRRFARGIDLSWTCTVHCHGSFILYSSLDDADSLQVLIWTGLAGGDEEYCAILVAVNSVLQMVLYAPLAILFIKVIGKEDCTVVISYSTVATSVAVFLGIPLGAAIITRYTLRKLVSPEWFELVFLKWLAPWSLIGLLYTILVLFASQGHQVVHQVVSVVRVAAPLIIYFVIIFFFTLWVTNKLGFGYKLGATQSFTAASNNFELAIAVAVATFGPNSDQALAATVGPLIEVPVLIALVYVVRWIGNRWSWKS
jgi:ACR3 family arsenite transporter